MTAIRWTSASVRDVVQIDIHGESCQFEIEKVKGCAALQHQLAFEEWVFVEFGEKFPQPEHFLEVIGGESCVFRELGDLCCVDFHV